MYQITIKNFFLLNTNLSINKVQVILIVKYYLLFSIKYTRKNKQKEQWDKKGNNRLLQLVTSYETYEIFLSHCTQVRGRKIVIYILQSVQILKYQFKTTSTTKGLPQENSRSTNMPSLFDFRIKLSSYVYVLNSVLLH